MSTRIHHSAGGIVTSDETIMRATRVKLAPTEQQAMALMAHGHAARAAYNYHLAAKIAAHQAWMQAVAEATYGELAALPPDEAEQKARKTVKVPSPNYMASIKTFFAEKEWASEVNRYAVASGMQGADTAWKNWIESFQGKRAGRRVGYPRFHGRGARLSFTLYHDVKRPGLRPVNARYWNFPKKVGGKIRLEGDVRLLAQRISRSDALVKSVTLSRDGSGWWASILCEETVRIPQGTTATQRAGGTVGVRLGATHLATLSTGETIMAPRPLADALERLAKAQQTLSTTRWVDEDGQWVATEDRKPGCRYVPSKRRIEAREKVARLHALVAQRRATAIHQLTKDLCLRFETVVLPDLDLVALTKSARGTADEPGTDVAVKAVRNQALLDAGLGEVARTAQYKAAWYGSRVLVAPRDLPFSRICAECGIVADSPGVRFRCTACGHEAPARLNSARVLALWRPAE